MNVVLFSASLRDFRPVWFLWPIMLFFSLLMLSFIPAIKEKLCFVRSVRGLKVFAIIQCIMLVGHIYAFATQLLPYYMGHYSVVEGNVEEFSAPTNIYNKREAFSVNGVWFEYGYSDISFRFLYKGIIINHNKKPSQPTLKRRFFKKKAAFFHGPVWERSGADFILKRKGEFF